MITESVFARCLSLAENSPKPHLEFRSLVKPNSFDIRTQCTKQLDRSIASAVCDVNRPAGMFKKVNVAELLQ